jgi:alginate O-acetyltransferase complex protein AlgI
MSIQISDIKLIMQYLPIHTIILFTLASLAFYYLSANATYKKVVLASTGLLFVALYGSPFYGFIILIITTIVFAAAKILLKKKSLFIAASMVLLSIACITAYKTGLWEKFSIVQSAIPALNRPFFNLSTIGISYFTFKYIHVIVDIYRGRLKSMSYLALISYIFFFPSFSAGPIARYPNFTSNFPEMRLPGKEDIDEGTKRIIYGLFKKFIIADKTYNLIVAYVPDITVARGIIKVIAVFLYSVQIYYDFSGYSDIAIGLGRLFGIKLPENFNKPYLKRNIALFWQNWHMTLTSWLREYVFLPVGKFLMPRIGSKHPWILNFICQMTTMSLVGIWHGFTLNYLAWGIYHGLGLSLYKIYSDLYKKYVPQKTKTAIASSRLVEWASIAATFIFVSIGWIFFYL